MVGAATGTKLKMKNQIGAAILDVYVGHIDSLDGPNRSKESIDVTALDSEGGYREFIDGFRDGGEVTLSGFFDFGDAGQQAMNKAFEGEGTCEFVIEFPVRIGAKWEFKGVVTELKTNSNVGDAVKFDATIKVSGKPILSALNDEDE